MSTRALIAALALLLFAACDKKPETSTAPTSTPSAASAAPSAAPTASASAAPSGSSPTVTASADDDIPTEEDFEDEAEKDIGPDNLEAELAKLEKEVK